MPHSPSYLGLGGVWSQVDVGDLDANFFAGLDLHANIDGRIFAPAHLVGMYKERWTRKGNERGRGGWEL